MTVLSSPIRFWDNELIILDTALNLFELTDEDLEEEYLTETHLTSLRNKIAHLKSGEYIRFTPEERYLILRSTDDEYGPRLNRLGFHWAYIMETNDKVHDLENTWNFFDEE